MHTIKGIHVRSPEAYLVDVIRLQQHLPQQAQEEWRGALHGEVSDDVILIGHGFPLPVLLLHVLLQVKTRLLWNIVLLEEGLKKERILHLLLQIIVRLLSVVYCTESTCAPAVERESRTECVRPNYVV